MIAARSFIAQIIPIVRKPIVKNVIRFFLTWFILHTLAIAIYGNRDNIQKSDAILVLGNKVEENGQPSERLERRLQRARDLYRDGSASLVVVSGGTGSEGYDEADVMRRYLIENGVLATAIIQDSYGKDTYSTAANFERVTDGKIQSVIVVSDWFHVARSVLALHRRLPNLKIGHARAYYAFHIKEFYYVFREYVGFYFYLFR